MGGGAHLAVGEPGGRLLAGAPLVIEPVETDRFAFELLRPHELSDLCAGTEPHGRNLAAVVDVVDGAGDVGMRHADEHWIVG